MSLTFVPGVESRTENKHDLKSGQGDWIGGQERVRCLPSIFPAYSMAPLVGQKAPPYRILEHVFLPLVASSPSWSSELGVFPCSNLVLGPQSEPIELQGSHGSEPI